MTHAVVLTSGARSKGCGLVEFATEAEALRAIQLLDNTTLDGRVIQVREDREKDGGHRGGNSAGAGPSHGHGGHAGLHGGLHGEVGGERPPKPSRGPRAKPVRNFDQEVRPPSNRLFVSNLSWQTTKQNLHLAFGKIPGLRSAEIEFTWNGRAKGSGIVEFDTVEQAQAAIDSVNLTELDGRVIFVQFEKFVEPPQM